ncbi:hypothetical protein JCM6882_007097 [Rhodosporidiobolus microsporus]
MSFVFLPPTVLDSIFRWQDGAVTLSNVTISKSLLPHTLRGLYGKAWLQGLQRIRQFAAAVNTRRKSLLFVRSFSLSDPFRFSVTQDRTWYEGGAERGRGQLNRGRVPYRPENLTVGFGLLRDLLRGMTNLTSLRLVGKPFIANLLARDFLLSRPFPQLGTLILVDEKTLESPGYDAATLFRRVQMITSLRSLLLNLNQQDHLLPLSLLDVSTSASLEPRTWSLEWFYTLDGAWLGPEIRHVFSSLNNSFKKLELKFKDVYPGLSSDLYLLPPSLRVLTLKFGERCPVQNPAHFPKVDAVLFHFPLLEHVHLYGNIVTSETFDALAGRSSLRCLILGRHTEPDGAKLLTFLDPNHPSYLPSLVYLIIVVCHCPSPSEVVQQSANSAGNLVEAPKLRKKTDPNWPPLFSRQQGEQILARAEEVKVLTLGSLVVALGRQEPASKKPLKQISVGEE